jgi:serine/threonine protein kinase
MLFPTVWNRAPVLSSRFRIVRFVARGSMGEVYEAEDQELREKVAIKTIRQYADEIV